MSVGTSGAVFSILGTRVVSTPVPTTHHRQIFRFQAEFNRLLPELQADEKNFQADLKSVREANMAAEQFNEAIEKTDLPARKKSRQRSRLSLFRTTTQRAPTCAMSNMPMA